MHPQRNVGASGDEDIMSSIEVEMQVYISRDAMRRYIPIPLYPDAGVLVNQEWDPR